MSVIDVESNVIEETAIGTGSSLQETKIVMAQAMSVCRTLAKQLSICFIRM